MTYVGKPKISSSFRPKPSSSAEQNTDRLTVHSCLTSENLEGGGREGISPDGNRLEESYTKGDGPRGGCGVDREGGRAV